MDDTREHDAITRRRALRDIGAAGLGLTALGGGLEGLLADAAAARTRRGSLRDIEHVIILIQENRSFDHYFGTLSGVRGFGDKHGRNAFFQRGPGGQTLHPFHLSTQCLTDLTHDWGPQHRSWNFGRMDGFLRAHESADGSHNGVPIAPETMGYYDRGDIPFYYSLADAFTLCDGYHCSVIGPTDPNRLMSLSGTIDPGGKAGGPLLETNTAGRTGLFSWRTMPEQLQAKGVTWKQYTGSGGVFDNVLTYFKQYSQGSELYARGVSSTYPDDFMMDLERGTLPQVSWLLLGLTQAEHASFSHPSAGEQGVRQVLEALLSRPKIWEKCALFITYDENGGFFDHVAPPTAPNGTKGEWVTIPDARLPAAAQGIRGPIGLGFRVPMLVVSPFSRGGLVSSAVFDHTSTLRFLETRFRVRVPNLSAWRRRVTGDLTSAFNFAHAPRNGRPGLAPPGNATCATYLAPPVTEGPFPRQERGKRRRPSGIVG